jgi:hypothetical protein
MEIIFKKRQTEEKRAANNRFEIRDYFVASDFQVYDFSRIWHKMAAYFRVVFKSGHI